MTLQTVEGLDLTSYDHIIVAFSGGKDSTAALLALLEAGARPTQIELWHHLVDDPEGAGLMDWPCTPAYVVAFAATFELPLFRSWKVGGFRGEMLRDQAPTAAIRFEAPTPNGTQTHTVGGQSHKLSTRLAFPQVGADLRTRWCSPYLKIDVARAAIRNQERFNHRRTLVVSGERAEESGRRSRYAPFEPDDTDLRHSPKARHVDRLRPILDWPEAAVWSALERHRVNAHPAYHLGWGRCSCACCIFGGADEFATLRQILPERFAQLVAFEQTFGKTLKRDRTLSELAAAGQAFDIDPQDLQAALNHDWNGPIFSAGRWRKPKGAFRHSAGPT